MKNKRIILPFEIKEVTDEGVIEGYASYYGNVDLGNDVVEKGAFKASIRKNGQHVPVLTDHRALIMSQAGFSTKLKDQDEGLMTTTALNLAVLAGNTVHKLAKQAMDIGAKMGMSIGYEVDESTFDVEK